MSQDLQYARLMRSFQSEPDNPSNAIRLANHISRHGNVIPDVDIAIQQAAQSRFDDMPKPSCPPCPPQRSCPPCPPQRSCPRQKPCPVPQPCPLPPPCKVCPTALEGIQGYVFQNKFIIISATLGVAALLFYFMGRRGVFNDYQ